MGRKEIKILILISQLLFHHLLKPALITAPILIPLNLHTFSQMLSGSPGTPHSTLPTITKDTHTQYQPF